MSGFRVDFPVTTIVRLPGSNGSLATVDGRTARQWIESAITYCDWRSGDSWRRLSNQTERFNPERIEWLQAKRILRQCLYSSSESERLHPALPVINPAPTCSLEEIALRGLPRSVVAAALISEGGGRYTDFKLLSHLSGLKLASMLAELRSEVAARAERTA